jgi:hypothetical protein
MPEEIKSNQIKSNRIESNRFESHIYNNLLLMIETFYSNRGNVARVERQLSQLHRIETIPNALLFRPHGLGTFLEAILFRIC